MKSRKALKASILFFSMLMSCSYGSKQTSASKGIIGPDDSTLITEKPAYAEYLAKDIDGRPAAGCNGVRVAEGRLFTADHCLKSFKIKGAVNLSGKAAASRFQSNSKLDLATGYIVGGGAPSHSLPIFAGRLEGTVSLQASWYDARIGKWRLSRGTGQVKGAFIEHDLDMTPGASGSGLYITDSAGKKYLVAIHLGYIAERGVNLAASVLGDFQNSEQSIQQYNYQPEGACCCYYRDASEAPLEKCFEKGDGDDDGSGGDGNSNGDGSGGHGNGDGSGGDPSGGEPGTDPSGPSDGGPSDGDGDSHESSPQGGNNEAAPGTGTGPGRGSLDGGYPIYGSGQGYGGSGGPRGNTRPCFECDQINKEIENQTQFNKDGCEPSPIEPLFKDVTVPEGITPRLTFNTESPSKFTESLKAFAERLLKKIKWKTDENVKSLPEDVQAKMQQWLSQVVKNLDDYYALVIASLKSDSIKEPELKDIDVSKESIQQARDYLDAVKTQVLNNPDQYLNARKEVIRAAEAAFGVAENALKNGDKETASAATQIGLAIADVAIGATPVFGWVKDAIEAGTGYSLLTGDKLDDFSRASAWVGVFTAGLGSKLLAAGKVAILATVVTKISKGGEAIGEADRIFLKAQGIYKAAREAGITTDTKDRIDKLVEAIKFRKPMATAQEIEKDVARSIERYKNLPLIKGEKPTNGLFAGETYLFDDLKQALKEKYPNGVKFDENGFPDFSPYAKELKGGQRSVAIDPTSSHKLDVNAANIAAGEMDGTPIGWTWHHHQDKGVMQLIPTDLHKTVKHHGGASIWGYNSKL